MIHPERDRSRNDKIAPLNEREAAPEFQDHSGWASASISRLGSVSTDIAVTTWAALKRPLSDRVETPLHSWRDVFDMRDSFYRLTPGYSVIGAAFGFTLATTTAIGTLSSTVQGDIKAAGAMLLVALISSAFGYGCWKTTKYCLKKHDELKAASIDSSHPT